MAITKKRIRKRPSFKGAACPLMGHKRTSRAAKAMSALPQKADIHEARASLNIFAVIGGIAINSCTISLEQIEAILAIMKVHRNQRRGGIGRGVALANAKNSPCIVDTGTVRAGVWNLLPGTAPGAALVTPGAAPFSPAVPASDVGRARATLAGLNRTISVVRFGSQADMCGAIADVR